MTDQATVDLSTPAPIVEMVTADLSMSSQNCTDQEMVSIETVEAQAQQDVISSQPSEFVEKPFEVSRTVQEYAIPNNKNHQPISNYLKGCKWSPDGACILTNSEDNCLRLFNLPESLYTKPNQNDIDLNNELSAILRMKEGGTIYDYCWYPSMRSNEPDSCILASTSHLAPIHFWDAYTGTIKATFRGYNHADEMVAAYSLAFSADGTRLVAGYDHCVRVFDPSVPGRQVIETMSTDKKTRQRGIISCIAFDPQNPERFAAGAYSKQIALYQFGTKEPVAFFEGHRGGVTHMQFAADGNRLFSGGRKDDEIICWDLRNMKILGFMKRSVKTHQRIYFDILNDQILASGNHDGSVSVWCLRGLADADEETMLEPYLKFEAHTDCVNGISFHPSLPLLATASGQRKFQEISDEDQDTMFVHSNEPIDSSLRLWWAS